MAVKLKKKKLISVVIKDESIRITEVTKSSKQIKVHKMVKVDVPVGAVSDGMIEKMDEVAAALKSALSLNGISSRDVIFSLVSGKIAIKEVVIPDVKENKIADIVNTNASEYFPVNIEQYIIKYTVLEKITEQDVKKLKLQVIAVPVTLVDAYYELAELIGLKIETMDYSGNSAYQLLKQQITNEFSVVINIDNESTVVSIFDNNALKMQRTIPYGRSVLIRAVMDELKLETEDEAITKLQEEKLLHISFDGDEVTDSLRYLVSSINRITDYYVSRNGSRHFEKAYIIGNITMIPGFIVLMSNELNTELIPIETLQNVVVDELTPEEEKKVTAYVQNIGALLEPVGIASNTEASRKKSGSSTRMLVYILIASVLVAAIITILPLMDMLSLESDVENAKKRVEELSYVNETVDKYYKAADIYRDINAFVNITSDDNDYLHNFIEQLEDKIPSDVSFSSMTVTSGSVTISGSAASKSSVAKLIQQLNTIDTVENVYVSNESEVKDNTDVITVSFGITCTFGKVAEVDE